MPRGRFPEGYPDIKLHVGIKNTDNKQQVDCPVTGSSRAVLFIHCPHSDIRSPLPHSAPPDDHRTVLTHAPAQPHLHLPNHICPTGGVQHLPEPKLEELTDILSKRAASLAAAGNGVCVFALADVATEFLRQNNAQPMSLHDRMLLRQVSLFALLV